jgi:hypothetical protein
MAAAGDSEELLGKRVPVALANVSAQLPDTRVVPRT